MALFGTYRRADLGTYRSAELRIAELKRYVSQSHLGLLLVRIAELNGAPFGTYRRAFMGIWYVSQSSL